MPQETASGGQARLSPYRAFAESGETMTEFARVQGTSYWKVKAAVQKSEGEVGGCTAALVSHEPAANARSKSPKNHFAPA